MIDGFSQEWRLNGDSSNGKKRTIQQVTHQ